MGVVAKMRGGFRLSPSRKPGKDSVGLTTQLTYQKEDVPKKIFFDLLCQALHKSGVSANMV